MKFLKRIQELVLIFSSPQKPYPTSSRRSSYGYLILYTTKWIDISKADYKHNLTEIK